MSANDLFHIKSKSVTTTLSVESLRFSQIYFLAICLFYNGKNKSGAEGDTLYTANSYCAGQALFDAKDPTKLIDRLDKPFYIPESDFEKSGQYPAGTVFIEGLVFYNQKWFLYYGCADSRVAVAVYDPLKK